MGESREVSPLSQMKTVRVEEKFQSSPSQGRAAREERRNRGWGLFGLSRSGIRGVWQQAILRGSSGDFGRGASRIR